MVDLESVEELYEGEIELYRTSSIVCFHVARPEEREGRSTALRRNGSTLMPAQPTRSEMPQRVFGKVTPLYSKIMGGLLTLW